jgi:Holliday junction resolvasome RuvABC endonuclease subunit
MRVLGVDPSLRLSGVARVVDGVLDATRIPTEKVRTLREQRDQVRYIVGKILRFAGDVDLAVIESMYVPTREGAQAGAVTQRAWVWGLVVDQLFERCPVVEVTTKQRAKYAADNGNADKAAVTAAVKAAYPNLRIRDDNEADAIALAAMGARHLGEPIDGTGTPKQLQVMAAVAWPTTTNGRKN